MSTLRFEVPAPFASWTADGAEYPPGETTIENASPELVRLASISHEQGILIVHEGLEDGHVESQEDSEANLVQAIADGTWHEGQIVQTALDAISKERVKRAVEAVEAERAEYVDAAVEAAIAAGADPDEAREVAEAQAEVAIPAKPENVTVDAEEVEVRVLDEDDKVAVVSAASILADHEHVWNPGGES